MKPGVLLTLPKLLNTVAWSPSNILSDGDRSVCYEAFGSSHMYQDALGLTPVTAVGDPIGLILDRSSWAGKSLTQILSEQPELFDKEFVPDINHGNDSQGAYDTETNEFSNTQVGEQNYRPTFRILDTEALKYYRVRLKFTGNLDPIFALTMTGSSSGDGHGQGGLSGNTIRANNGTIEFIGGRFGFGTNPGLTLWTDGRTTWDGLFIDVDECSVKEVPGNHAYQETTSARPIYQSDGASQWITFDGVDDVLSVILPDAVEGDILIAGRNGSIIAPISYEAGTTFSLGPDTYTDGDSGVIAAVGGIVGVLMTKRTLTQDEQDQLIQYYMTKGAKGLLED